jgi:hypothetical protein
VEFYASFADFHQQAPTLHWECCTIKSTADQIQRQPEGELPY